MTTFLALYTQAPFWVWLAAGAVAIFKALGLKLGLAFDLPLFVALTGGGVVLSGRLPAPKAPKATKAAPSPEPPRRAEPPAPPRVGTPEYNARLIGRIARTTGRFANGVGRVWIDGAEWSAELSGGEDDLAPDTPVRIMRVIGAIKLQVCTLNSPQPAPYPESHAAPGRAPLP